MNNINWKEVVAFVLRAIANGLDKTEAISQASVKFGISQNDIKNKI
jgi:hypothetical protein